MLKTAIIAILLSTLPACGTAPTRSTSQTFSVISEQADSVASSLILLIRVSSPANQTNVKSIAESVIASRKGEYRHIIGKSYAEGMTAGDAPLAISRLEGGARTRGLNSLGGSQKIPTH